MAAWMVAMASTNADEVGGGTDDDVMSVHVEAVRAGNLNRERRVCNRAAGDALGRGPRPVM